MLETAKRREHKDQDGPKKILVVRNAEDTALCTLRPSIRTRDDELRFCCQCTYGHKDFQKTKALPQRPPRVLVFYCMHLFCRILRDTCFI